MKNPFLILFLAITQSVFSQGEANNWYFGDGAGLDFNSGKPIALNNGELYTSEGCATMSTENGRLLFYTEGVNIWDSTHNVMPNGSGLLGNKSTTQSSIIVPKPGNKGIFYVFAVDAQAGKEGLTYSEVDMSLNSGKGDISTGKKNIKLIAPVCEKIASTMHTNGEDIWVLTHKYDADTIYAYQVTKSGIGAKPVKSVTGVFFGYPVGWTGQMKISPNGKRIVASDYNKKGFIGFFDPSSGKVSNVWSLPFPSYGLEFSPSSNYLYSSLGGRIFQHDLKSITQKALIESQKTIDSGKDVFWSFQLAPDGKIYIANPSYYLHAIHAPDSSGKNCRFQRDVIDLKGRSSTIGLPNFISSYFNWIDFDIKGSCLNDSIFFTIPLFKNSDSLRWNFGDTLSGISNTSIKSTNVFHIYKKRGIYKISLTNYYKNQKYLRYLFLEIKSPEHFLGNDTIICYGNSIKTGSKKEYASYYWNTDSVTKTIFINNEGKYILKVWDDEGCTGADTIFVKSIFSKPKLGNDTVICYGNSLTISPNKNYLTYKWSNDSNTQFIRIADTGSYSLTTVDSFGCREADTILVKKAKTKAYFEAGDICETDTVKFINKSIDGKIFNWNFGDGNSSNLKSPHHQYKTGGISRTFNVSLVVKLVGVCVDSITKSVTINANPKSDYTYTESNNIWNFTPTQSGNTKYRWLFGDGDSVIATTASHSYKDGLSSHTVCLKVTNAASCISETCKQITTTGIYYTKPSGFKIYPNPNTGNFTIEIENPEKDILIEVYNSMGERVKIVGMVGKVISINMDVAAGIYLVKVKNGEVAYNQKVSIVQ